MRQRHRITGLPSKRAESETLYATASATNDENVTFTPPFSMTLRCFAWRPASSAACS